MSLITKVTGAEFDSMVERGAFDAFGPKKIELINGELRFTNPAGPIHDDYIQFLTRWSTDETSGTEVSVRVQCGFVCDDDRPEPDVLWLQPKRYGRTRPTAADVLLLIEVADSSLPNDLREKADIYASSGVREYWVIDIPGLRLHIMSASNGKTYRDIEVVFPPRTPAPQCRPGAKLNLAALFEVS